LIDSLVGLLVLLFFAFIAMIFWALAPRTHQA
jgi:cbb3-type cytochrome oxidase subunit 3